MKRFLLPVIAASLLAGCVYGDYAYRGYGTGDYYYGRPYVDYRYYGGYGGYYGGYYPYGYYRYGYPYHGYGYGYGYGYPYGGYYPYRPYYYPYRHHYPYRPYRPDGVVKPGPHHPGGHDRSDRPPPWRDLGSIPGATPRNDPRPDVVAPNMRQPRVIPARPSPEARMDDGGVRAGTPMGSTRRTEPSRRRGESVSRQDP